MKISFFGIKKRFLHIKIEKPHRMQLKLDKIHLYKLITVLLLGLLFGCIKPNSEGNSNSTIEVKLSEENSFSNIYKVTIQIDMLATMVREYDQLGLCWNKQGMPTIEDDHLIVDITSNKAVFEIENLEQGSLYYAKTFASVNGTGYIYGEEMEFSTLSTSEVYPDFDDIIFSEYNLNSIKISANVTEKTDYPITEISVSLYTFEDDIYTEVKNKKISVEGLSKGIIFEELTKNTMYLAKTITLVNENILYSDYNKFSTLSDADVSPSFGAIAFSDINLTSATVNISITKNQTSIF